MGLDGDKPRHAGADADELGGVSARVDVSAYIALVLLALMLAELLFRVLPARARREDMPTSARGDEPPMSGGDANSNEAA